MTCFYMLEFCFSILVEYAFPSYILMNLNFLFYIFFLFFFVLLLIYFHRRSEKVLDLQTIFFHQPLNSWHPQNSHMYLEILFLKYVGFFSPNQVWNGYPFSSQCSLLVFPKTSENQRFLGCSQGNQKETSRRKRVIRHCQ